jgi:hypothetical protein
MQQGSPMKGYDTRYCIPDVTVTLQPTPKLQKRVFDTEISEPLLSSPYVNM